MDSASKYPVVTEEEGKEDYHELQVRLITNDVREIAKDQARKDAETGLYDQHAAPVQKHCF